MEAILVTCMFCGLKMGETKRVQLASGSFAPSRLTAARHQHNENKMCLDTSVVAYFSYPEVFATVKTFAKYTVRGI